MKRTHEGSIKEQHKMGICCTKPSASPDEIKVLLQRNEEYPQKNNTGAYTPQPLKTNTDTPDKEEDPIPERNTKNDFKFLECTHEKQEESVPVVALNPVLSVTSHLNERKDPDKDCHTIIIKGEKESEEQLNNDPKKDGLEAASSTKEIKHGGFTCGVQQSVVNITGIASDPNPDNKVEETVGEQQYNQTSHHTANDSSKGISILHQTDHILCQECTEINEVEDLDDIGEDFTKENAGCEVSNGSNSQSHNYNALSGVMETLNESAAETYGHQSDTFLDHNTAKEHTDVANEPDTASEIDLYRGEEEMQEDNHLGKNRTRSEEDLLVSQDRCSISPEVDILTYSEREWRGNTAKSALIRKGYEDISKSYKGIRRVRGDNYCALRATLYQTLIRSDDLPIWLQGEDILQLPLKLCADNKWIEQWRLSHAHQSQNRNFKDIILECLELLKKKWEEVVLLPTVEDKEMACDEIFRHGDEENSLLEAIKFLMLGTAIELYNNMQQDKEVPLFCWLLFARDTSSTPCSFLINHLNHVGLSGGLEQVEMFLLGYTLQYTITVYRLYKCETDEFISYYPDDHKEDWPAVCLITEDDRHYNVPVKKQEETSLTLQPD
ncbi:OTU deubiquitinase with linear linkage specificity b isoform X1 [Polypterus senegalus]|nr:OTU deubiquitinase with linear linkage specificity b isoform X1 [Polypterus senegalus]XP_039610815.1 OTU deubiquitinase with linear linkage specificity b isoform X1 [Polypterus senegalus]